MSHRNFHEWLALRAEKLLAFDRAEAKREGPRREGVKTPRFGMLSHDMMNFRIF